MRCFDETINPFANVGSSSVVLSLSFQGRIEF
jgi:hypothetical protein